MPKEDLQNTWFNALQPGSGFGLLEFLPDILYFAKDEQKRFMAGNRAFVERCGYGSEAEIIGCSDHDIFPVDMAEKYRSDDQKVIDSGEPLMGIVELFPNRVGHPELFVTNKVPVFSQSGKCVGLCGTVRGFERSRSHLQPHLDLFPVTKYLEKNYAAKVSMPALANMVGMSVRKLQRRFQEAFKTTPTEYITRLRILKASKLLVETRKKITDIASDIGYCDHSVFSKKFSSILGVSPTAYRKRYEPENRP